jgi:hypothetical protein
MAQPFLAMPEALFETVLVAVIWGCSQLSMRTPFQNAT